MNNQALPLPLHFKWGKASLCEKKNNQTESFLLPIYAGLKDGWGSCREPATKEHGTTQTLHIGVSSTAYSRTHTFFPSHQNLRILIVNLAWLTHFQHPVSGPSWYMHMQVNSEMQVITNLRGNHRIIGLLRLEKTTEMIKSNHRSITVVPTEPCHSIHIGIHPAMMPGWVGDSG